jgi:hypothetical protein
MAELGIGVVTDILLHLVPVTLIVADLLTVGTYRDDAAQRPDLVQCLLKSPTFFFEFSFRLFALRDVHEDCRELARSSGYSGNEEMFSQWREICFKRQRLTSVRYPRIFLKVRWISCPVKFAGQRARSTEIPVCFS